MAGQNPNKKNRTNLGKDAGITSEFMTREQAASFLNITPGTLSNLHSQEKGPVYYRKGKLSYYLKSDLVAWIMAGRVEPRPRQQEDDEDGPEPAFLHDPGQVQ